MNPEEIARVITSVREALSKGEIVCEDERILDDLETLLDIAELTI
jgi:hypothetical protein